MIENHLDDHFEEELDEDFIIQISKVETESKTLGLPKSNNCYEILDVMEG